MRARMRRITAMLVSLVMLLTCMPLTTLADIVLDNSASVQLFSVVPDSAVYVTYEFYNGTEQVGKQIVNQTKGEKPTLEPATPETQPGEKFKGWYIGEEKYEPGRASSYSANTTVKVEAKYGPAVYVYFLTKEGTVYKSVEVTSEDNTVSLPNDYEPANCYVTGWRIQGTDTAFTAESVVEESVYVEPVTEPCWWVTFDTLGYGGVESRYVENGDATDLSTVAEPTRVGYEFGGWTTVKNDEKTLVGDTYTVTDNVMLYALWVPDYVDYTVVYWGENADDDGYSMLASRLVKADSEDTYRHTLTSIRRY